MNELFVLGGRVEFDGVKPSNHSVNPETLLHLLKCGFEEICTYRKNKDDLCRYTIIKDCKIREKFLDDHLSSEQISLCLCGWDESCGYLFKRNKGPCSGNDLIDCHLRENIERNFKEYLSSKR